VIHLNEAQISERLIKYGKTFMDAPKDFIRFTEEIRADELLNNIDFYPHAFVLACVMDRQIKAERAWLIPYQFQLKLGDFSMKKLLSLSNDDVRQIMAKPEPLHRFVDKMASCFYFAIQRINSQYDCDASRIWNGCPSSAIVVYRFLEFEGVGPKIATMAANILARDFKIQFSDYYSIDISVDVHVRRVFGRLGLTPQDATAEQLIFRARGLHPKFPGILDFPAWEIGRNWCKSKNPLCKECSMSDLCPSSSGS